MNKGRVFSFTESYLITVKAFRSFKYIKVAKKNGVLSSELSERVMLAVTEVNGCAGCSYAHAKMALEAGLTPEQIQDMLSGMVDDIPKEQLSAVLFAQHYADTLGKASLSSWEGLKQEYGEKLSLGILSSIRIIMMGNAFGIPISLFAERFKKVEQPDPRRNIWYELSMMFAFIIIIPVAAIHTLVNVISRTKYVDFK